MEIDSTSPEDRALLEERLFEIRESYDQQVDNYEDTVVPAEQLDETDSTPPNDEGTSKAIEVDDESEYLTTPSSIIKFIRKNTRASLSGASTLAEPSAISEGRYWFAAGNTHVEYSSNRGKTWTNIPIPAGPTAAPYACCDIDIVYDKSRGLTIYSILYLNARATNGVVRTFIRRNNDSTAYTCSYDWGTSGNAVPDYPHLGLSDNYLWMSINDTGNNRARVYRLPLHEMGECAGFSYKFYDYNWTYGQRVIVPIEGATDTMYWGMYQTSNTFRVYKWPENSTTITSVARTVNTETFSNPDCRGGNNNADFIEKSTAWSITGFRLRGALSRNNGLLFMTNANTASHSYAHVAGVRFKESDLTVIDQPDVWGGVGCFGFPALSVNDRGDYGLSVAYGGGTSGKAAEGYVLLDDSYTSGVNFGTYNKTASGNYNRTDGRYGDYFTIRRAAPCGLFFTATNYSLNGGTAVSNVNSVVAKFGRGRDDKCRTGWDVNRREP